MREIVALLMIAAAMKSVGSRSDCCLLSRREPTDSTAAIRQSLLARDRALSASVRRDGFAHALPAALAPDGLLLFEGTETTATRANTAQLLASQAPLAAARVQWLPLGV